MSPKADFDQESGQALITTAVCMLCLVGFLGLATDVGMLFRDKVNLQKVADAAAIAGATQISTGSYSAAAVASAAKNGVTNGTNGTVTATLGGAYHPNAVKVVVSQNEPNFFMSAFGQGSTTVAATAVAGITNGNGCMLALDQHPFKDQGMTTNGTGNVNAPNCAIYDNSGLNMNGSGSITAKFVGVAGTYDGPGVTPDPVTGMVPVSDPMKYWSTPPAYGSCANDPNAKAGDTVIPGCYKGLTITGPGVVVRAGLYIIQKNQLTLANVTATGVTFYIDGATGATFGSINGSTLSAPITGTSGTCTAAGGCNGMLIWDTETNAGKPQQGIDFGPGSSTLSGILYFPFAPLKFHGNNNTTLNADIIAQAFVFDGTISINNYVLSPGQEPLLLTPTLLE
jgi:putative Flp pilus-assembly TadE/G-like protein